MKLDGLARPVALFIAAVSLILSGLVGSPAAAGDDQGLGTPAAEPSGIAAAAATWIYREHSSANHERVDLPNDRIDKVKNQHNINFAALVRAIEWARSPRCSTSSDGVDRGIYKYKIYEYVRVNGDDEKTGRWVIIQSIIEWGDGHADRGWMVTAYPVKTHSGAPAKKNGKSWAPGWLADSNVFGPINNEVLC